MFSLLRNLSLCNFSPSILATSFCSSASPGPLTLESNSNYRNLEQRDCKTSRVTSDLSHYTCYRASEMYFSL